MATGLERVFFARVLATTPPRGGGTQAALEFHLQSVELTWSWGAQPGSAVCGYVREASGSPGELGSGVALNALVELRIGTMASGGGAERVTHRFWGLCKGDNGNVSSRGNTRTLQFADLREFLAWDHVFGAFNMAETVLVTEAGVTTRRRRWWHIFPRDHTLNLKTYTDAPLTAREILDYLFTAPTVETGWARVYHPDQATFPVYELDFMGGERLDSALVKISEAQKLVFTLSGRYELRWARKGYLLAGESFPTDGNGNYVFPANSDEQRDGWALSGNATRVTVVGDRNLYQVMGIGMEPDWSRAWERFWDFTDFEDYVYGHFEYAPGKTYKAWPTEHAEDPTNIVGRQMAVLRALTMTVREFGAVAGPEYFDFGKIAGRSRMDMPCRLYLETLVFRAFRPPPEIQINGRALPITCMELEDRMLAQVTHDPLTAEMTADVSVPIEGNGYGIAKGYQVASDMFRILNPARFNPNDWINEQDVWQSIPFQTDDSGFGSKFIVFDTPVIRSPDLYVMVDGYAVENARPTLLVPPVRASLTFRIERFKFALGQSGRDAVVNESALRGEYVCSGPAGTATEILYADGEGVLAKARALAESHLQAQWAHKRGGHTRWLEDGEAGTVLNGMYDRVTLAFSPSGFSETVDFTTEAERNYFLPERDYDHSVASRNLFPGQEALRKATKEQALYVAGLSANPSFLKVMRDAHNSQRSGEPDGTPRQELENAPDGTTLKVGTPLWKKPNSAAPAGLGGVDVQGMTNTLAALPEATTEEHTVFAGATVRDGETATRRLPVARHGNVYVRALGPVAVGDGLGRVNGEDYLGKVSSGAVLVAQQAVGDGETRLILAVAAGGGGGKARNVWQ